MTDLVVYQQEIGRLLIANAGLKKENNRLQVVIADCTHVSIKHHAEAKQLKTKLEQLNKSSERFIRDNNEQTLKIKQLKELLENANVAVKEYREHGVSDEAIERVVKETIVQFWNSPVPAANYPFSPATQFGWQNHWGSGNDVQRTSECSAEDAGADPEAGGKDT